MDHDEVQAVQHYLGIDLNDPAIRQRAWHRLRLFHQIIAECEADDNHTTAKWLRRICQRATDGRPDAICLAILAGLESD